MNENILSEPCVIHRYNPEAIYLDRYRFSLGVAIFFLYKEWRMKG